VAHEVTNVGSARAHLVEMAKAAREALGRTELTAIADRGYYSSYLPKRDAYRCPAGEHAIHRFASEMNGLMVHKYWSSACPRCALRSKCTTSDYRHLTRWEHETVLERMQARLERDPTLMTVRRRTVEHPFGTIKAWMGATHFLCRRLPRVSAEMSLHVLAYNLKRVMKIMGTGPMIEALRA
jgi:hypothetical protein